MVLIDTSVWIYALRRGFHPGVKARVDGLLATERVATNGLIMVELLGGAHTEAEHNRLRQRIESLFLVDAGRELWMSAARLAFELRRKGVTVPAADAYIAATAMRIGARLVHADAHFDMIAAQTELLVENLSPLLA